ncbi:MAG: flagellar biosynthesis protein FlhB [Gammaproteobacteria bacterium]|jgi:flagellar biosynthetic protein FlhB|nr:flagellar biosynthesis protein FlhB [Gammaproteobacteria bacterium]NBX40014.1 flagellar biosynthesis protein FlhB [Gammaproteobacteria bacterium]
MADDDSDEEKTEEPTSRRLNQARERGEMPRSPDFGGAMIVLAICGLFILIGRTMVADISAMMVRTLTFDRNRIEQIGDLPGYFAFELGDAFWIVRWVFFTAFVIAIAASIFNGGFNFSGQAAAPKFSKMNPLTGLKRMFGPQAWMGVLRNLAKFLTIGAVLFLVLSSRRHELVALSREAFEPMIANGASLAMTIFTVMTVAVAALAALDVPYQRWQYLRRLRMSKKEVRDEMKDIEGRPEVRQQIRRKQRELSRGRMLSKVKDADVIIVNPTEFAVALQYDEERSSVPIVLAKGRGDVARSIKERGEAAAIPRVEAPPLARALYYTTEVDAPIPEGLYRAVAAVLAYVFRLSALSADLKTPELAVPDVPPEFLFDEDGRRVEMR